ncbi:multiprotein Na+/H+ antiporter/ subunit A [Cyanobium sp. NS01]|nr:hydrogenase subunit MbhD domain-containing protein [Cyanobium sp. NS01]QNI70286.1 multiprotein Na+/H+ antiporter/ subunit A [Cyanobium sp. NS01]
MDFTLTTDAALLLPITALLPLTAILLVAQSNPYQTLVMRGILGAVAALIYALLGAADVALTEALVGTLLSTTLYAVALRSSMVLRLSLPGGAMPPEAVSQRLRSWLEPLHLRLELVPQPQPGEPGLHGRLIRAEAESAYALLLHRPQLLDHLASLPGADGWRQEGHRLELIRAEGPVPAPALAGGSGAPGEVAP